MSIVGHGGARMFGNGNIQVIGNSGGGSGGTATVYKFIYTGADQSFTIPSNANTVTIQCWGAGGASQGYGGVVLINTGHGGGGGFTQAVLNSSYANKTIKVIVGQGGQSFNLGNNAPATYGGGGSQTINGDVHWGTASGGGRSAVQLLNGGTYYEIVTAGGGGSAGGLYNNGIINGYGSGGAGGGLIGSTWGKSKTRFG